VIADASGNIYGSYPGDTNRCLPPHYTNGCGFAYEISDGVLTVLHNFNRPDDGWDALGTPIMDRPGNLYGTTHSGGRFGAGTVFELSPNSDGSWSEKVLYSFKGGPDGAAPLTLALVPTGSIYGITQAGGLTSQCNNQGCGVAFKLKQNPDGTWAKRTLHEFGETAGDGKVPQGLITDNHGNFYGTTNIGGASSVGTVFKMDEGGNVTILHSFAEGTDGKNPGAGVIEDAAGNLYGTTSMGGVGGGGGHGVVFKITP
jgi:uncharacterized repeat protein (TIGR03803 family)